MSASKLNYSSSSCYQFNRPLLKKNTIMWLQKYWKSIIIIFLISFLLSICGVLYYYFRPEKRKLRHYHRGVILLKEKRFINASWEFRDALAIAPKDSQILYHLAKAYAGNEEYEKAANTLETLLSNDPNYHSAYLFLSSIYLQQKKYQQSLAICDEFLKIKPDDVDANNERGIILWRMGYKKQAEYEFVKIIEKKPEDFKSYLHLARLYWDMKQNKDAIEVLKNYLLKYDSKNLDVRLELANYYVAQREYTLALPEFELLSKESITPTAFSPIAPGYAYTLLSLGHFDMAFEIANTALLSKAPSEDSTPKDPILAYIRGVVRLEKQQYSEAINDLLWVQRRYKGLAEVHYHLGRAYFATKKYLLAIQFFENAVAILPNSPQMIRSLLEALIQEKRWDRALDYANNYLKLDPKNLEILNIKAQILIQLGFHSTAEKILQELNTNKNSLDTQVSMALLEASRKNYDKAIGILKNLDQTLPNNFYVHFLLSQVYFSQQKLGPSLQHIFKSIELNPNYIASRQLLIQIRRFQKKYDLAIQEYEKLRKKDNEDERWILELANLYLENEQPEKALKLLQNLGYEKSKDIGFLQCFGEIYFAKKEYLESLRYLKQVPPKEAKIYYLIGDCYFYLGRYYEAINNYEMVKEDKEPLAWLRIAVTLYLQREWKLAISILEQYTAKNSDELAQIFMAIHYVMESDIKPARKILSQIPRQSQFYWLVHLVYTSIHFYEENFTDMEQELQKLSISHRALANDFKNLVQFCKQNRANFTPVLGALVLREMNYPYAASIKCKESLQILNRHPVVETIHAGLLRRLGEANIHETWLRLAQNSFVSGYVWKELGMYAFHKQEYASAEQYLKQALEVDPNMTDAITILGMVYAEEKKIEQAIVYFQKLLPITEKLSDVKQLCQVYNNLAWLNLELVPPQSNTALQWAKKAVEKMPWNPATLDTLGWCYFHQQDYNKAFENLIYAQNIAPNEPTIYYHLAEVSVKLKQTDFAIQFLNQAMLISQTFPEFPKAQKLLESLQKP